MKVILTKAKGYLRLTLMLVKILVYKKELTVKKII